MHIAKVLFASLIVAGTCMMSVSARAGVILTVDVSERTLEVRVDGVVVHSWSVSKGRPGYRIPYGTFRVQSMERDPNRRSGKYGSLMAYPIFFWNNYAIHGTDNLPVGREVSHGCFQLTVEHARALFDIVAPQRGSTRVIVQQ